MEEKYTKKQKSTNNQASKGKKFAVKRRNHGVNLYALSKASFSFLQNVAFVSSFFIGSSIAFQHLTPENLILNLPKFVLALGNE